MPHVSDRNCRRALALCVIWICVSCGDTTARNPAAASKDDSSVAALPEISVEDRPAAEAPARLAEADSDERRAPTLTPVQSCDEIQALLRRDALAHMNMRYDEWEKAARDAAVSVPDKCKRVTFEPRQQNPIRGRATLPPPSRTGMIAWMRPGGSTASETSSTNNQVAGVDEADFIKNDDKYVYAAMNGAFRVIEAWPAASAHEVANIKLDGEPKKLLLEGDRALVYVSRKREANTQRPFGASQNECNYAYDCDFRGDGTETSLVLFDISDRKAPKQLRRIDVSASLLAARRIGDAVHTVFVTPELIFPNVLYPVVSPDDCEAGTTVAESLQTALMTLKEQRTLNTQLIEDTSIDQLLPQIVEEGHKLSADSCNRVYGETVQTGRAVTTVLSLSLSKREKHAVSNIISKPGAVYASANALYLAVNQRQSPDFSTAIHKLSLSEDVERTAYAASGQVEGNVLNQFSLDEYKEHLRVATSFGKVPSPNVHSALTVLAQHGEKLELTGKVDDIAPSEDIRSVRFDRDRAFVVTFKKTDPLYAFDLSDPRQPKITGELEIPGFSTYMHLLDDKHLLTIGYAADDQGSFAYFAGVLLQLFDVSDMTEPKLAHKLEIGTRGSSSQALNDHLAFTLFKDKLALPMTLCEGGGTEPTRMNFGGLMLFDVSVKQGISERGRVAHPNESGQYDDKACNNWWTKATSTVKRSVFMDDFVYSISSDSMRVQNLDALGNDVAQVALGN